MTVIVPLTTLLHVAKLAGIGVAIAGVTAWIFVIAAIIISDRSNEEEQ